MIPSARNLVPALAVCLALAPAAYADSVGDLASLIEDSSKRGDPTTAFLAGFDSLGDLSMNGDEVRAALARADVSPDGPLAPVIGNATGITKSGSSIDIRRTQSSTLDMPEGAGIRLGKRVEFQLTSGFVGTLGSDAAARMKDASGTYYRIDDIGGIEVRESGGSFYTLYELYLVTENEKTVAYIKAGVWFRKKWVRIEIPSVEAPAPIEASVREEDGLPTPVTTALTEETAPANSETRAASGDGADLPSPSDAPLAARGADEPTPLADAPVEDTSTTESPDLTTDGSTEQVTGQRQGMLDLVAEVVGQDVALSAAPDSSDPPIAIETPEGLASASLAQIQQPTQATETVVDEPVEELLDARRQVSEIAPQGERALDKPIKELLEASDAEVTEQSSGAESEPVQVTVDRPLGEDTAEAVVEAPTATPEAIKIPEPEEKERIDQGAETQRSEFDAMGAKLDALIALMKKDPAEANRSAAQQVEELEKQNARLEAMIKEQNDRITQLTQRLDDERRSLPGDDYRGGRDRDELRRDRDVRRVRDGARDADRDRYYDSRGGRDRYGNRVSGPGGRDRGLDRRGRDRGFDRRSRPAADFPISNANGANAKKKDSMFERLLAAVLQGLQKGLQKRYARQATRNVNNRAALLAGNNRSNAPYANYRIGNAVNNSNLGRTVGANPWNTRSGAANVPYNNNSRVPVGATSVQPYRPVYQPTYRVAPSAGRAYVPIQPAGGNPLMRR